MIVVGSGAIGVEFAYFYSSLGTKVTVVEFLPNIVPLEDEEVSKHLEKSLKKAGIEVMTNSSVESVDTTGEGVKAKVKRLKVKLSLKQMLYFLQLVFRQILKISDLKKLVLKQIKEEF